MRWDISRMGAGDARHFLSIVFLKSLNIIINLNCEVQQLWIKITGEVPGQACTRVVNFGCF